MIYLASPYASPERYVMDWRFHQVAYATAHFLKQGVVVYSPIAHNHYLAVNFDLPRDWSFWAALDLPMLDLASELWVLELPGWSVSHGVSMEIEHASRSGKPITYLKPEEVCGPDYQHC